MPANKHVSRQIIRRIGDLSESLEDYLEIIFQLAEKQGAARVRDIAAAKSVKMSSVTSALKRLDREGLIAYEAREIARLTTEGENLAQRLLKRHHFLTSFLVDILKIDPKTAAKDACSMEHVLSQKTMNSLYNFSEFLQGHQDSLKDFFRAYGRAGRENT